MADDVESDDTLYYHDREGDEHQGVDSLAARNPRISGRFLDLYLRMTREDQQWRLKREQRLRRLKLDKKRGKRRKRSRSKGREKGRHLPGKLG